MFESIDNPKQLTRREFFKTLPKLLKDPKLQSIKDRSLNTTESVNSQGIKYYPLYETDHAQGPSELPHNGIGAIFLEGSDIKSYIGSGDKTLKMDSFNCPLPTLVGILKDRNERYAAFMGALEQLSIPIGIGDIGAQFQDEITIKVITEEDKVRFFGGLAITALSVVPLIRACISQASPTEDEGTNKHMTRRDFLKKVGYGIGGSLLLFVPGVRQLASTEKYSRLLFDLKNRDDLPRPVKDIVIRVDGLISHLRPDNAMVFTRNLIMALKIKQMGEDLKITDKNPEMAYLVGAGHSGIEDMIMLPQDVLQAMIVYMNTAYIDAAVHKLGRQVATTRIFQFENGEYKDKPPVVDHKLLQMLSLE